MAIPEQRGINVSEIYELIDPLSKDPGNCELFEQILLSDRVVGLMRGKSYIWTVEFMMRINNAHPIHNNPSVHGLNKGSDL